MPIPFEVVWVPGGKAVATLQELRRREGITPVLLGGREAFERVEEKYDMDEGADLQTMLNEAAGVDAISWFRQRQEEDPEYYDVELGDWQGAQPNTEIRAHEDVLSREPFPEVAIVLIPTDKAWQVPCYLRAGGWNEVPSAAEMTAIFRYWADEYGATVALDGRRCNRNDGCATALYAGESLGARSPAVSLRARHRSSRNGGTARTCFRSM